MKLPNFLNRIFRGRSIVQPVAPRQLPDDLSNDQVAKLVQMVEQTQEQEYSCEEAYEFLDQFAELVVRGEDASQLMPLVDHHLKMCPDCREEYEALLKIMESTK